MPLQILDHPLAAHLLANLRDKSTAPEQFRWLTENLTTLLVLQATYRIGLRDVMVENADQTDGEAKTLNQSLAAVPVLRARAGDASVGGQAISRGGRRLHRSGTA